MKKTEKTCLKSIILKFFWCNSNDPYFNLFKFLGETNLDVLKLWEKNAVNKANNNIINKTAEDFEKIVTVTKLEELKQCAKLQKWKTHNQK